MAGNDSMTKETPLKGTPLLDTSKSDANQAGTVAGAEGRVDGMKRVEYPTADGGKRDEDRKAKLAEADDAEREAAEARIRLDDAHKRAADSKLTDEQRDLRGVQQEADDAAAKAAEARRAAGRENPRTVADARVAAPVDPNLPAGHHRAQKFGNDPANPKGYKGEHDDPEKQTVRMTLRSPDTAEPRETFVHPDMVGNYARAGWEADSTTL